MFLKTFGSSVQLYRKYLLSMAKNYVSYNSYKLTSVTSCRYWSIASKQRMYSHSILSEITCHKCQVRCYSRGPLDGDISALQNAQKEKELSNLSALFPNPRVTLNELAAKCPGDVFDIQYKQTSVAPKGIRKKSVQNDWTCSYMIVWPQKVKFEGTAKSKRQAAEKAALQALHWLHINKHIDNKGHPVYDKSVIEELNSSLQEPIRATISENSVEKIRRIWEDYENGIKDIYTATFKAAARRSVTTAPAILSKDSTIDEEDELSENSESTTEIENVSEMKIPVHPVYGRHVSPATETALDRRKRRLTKTFQVYDEERTPLPIDEYRYVIKE